MCISAVVNGSVVEYILQSTGSANLGWMAMFVYVLYVSRLHD